MPLSTPAARQRLHARNYAFEGFQREDGLWDIEGRLTDTKTYGFDSDYRGRIAAGEPVHDMWIRLTLDVDFVVQAVEATTDAGPFAVCPAVAPNLARMVGAKIGLGWRRAIQSRLGGVEGCTHLSEMLGAMGTVAFQTLYPVRVKQEAKRPPGERPGIIDSCHAFRSDGAVVKKSWPEFYTGE